MILSVGLPSSFRFTCRTLHLGVEELNDFACIARKRGCNAKRNNLWEISRKIPRNKKAVVAVHHKIHCEIAGVSINDSNG